MLYVAAENRDKGYFKKVDENRIRKNISKIYKAEITKQNKPRCKKTLGLG